MFTFLLGTDPRGERVPRTSSPRVAPLQGPSLVRFPRLNERVAQSSRFEPAAQESTAYGGEQERRNETVIVSHVVQ